ncbi:major facilitator superfamily domain-containing protein 8-like isoform X2 [Littorina saxatilis]|uniref:major facilitator superfamily domain-containing protein 8-like isoform X2 n=1 Tax=Littorina saxatilis TaxID=31220 RepID=UPI0038B4A56D
MYFTMCMSSVTFPMTMSTLWPYLQVVDTSATPSLLGWVVAAYSLGQLVASPLFGLWSAYRKAREPLVVSLLLQMGANVFYGYVQSIHGNGGGYLILSRVIMGLASGNAAVVRAYVSGATTLAERTGAMSSVSIFQSVGFILGPVIQTLLVLIKYPGPVEKSWLHFNMYTTPAFLAAVLAVVNFVLLLTIFQLHTVDDSGIINVAVNDDDDEEEEMEKKDKVGNTGPPDFVAIFVSMYLFFIVFFMFTIFETIGTPLLMDMYGWSKSEAAFYMGIMLASAGFLAIGVFIVIKILANKGVDERRLLVAGYIFCFFGFFTYLPWGNDLPVIGYAPVYTAATIIPSQPFISTHSFVLPWQQDRPPAWQQQGKQLTDHRQDFAHNMFQNSTAAIPQNGVARLRTASEAVKGFAAKFSEHKNRIGVSKDNESVTVRRRRRDVKSSILTKAYLNKVEKLDAMIKSMTEASLNKATRQGSKSSLPSSSTILSTTTTTVTVATAESGTSQTSPSSDIITATSESSITTANSTLKPNTTTSATTIITASHTTSFTPESNITIAAEPSISSSDSTFSKPESNTTSTTTTPVSTTSPASNSTTNTTVAPEGCPWNFGWCGQVPKVRLFQFILGTAFIAIGYPTCNVMTYTLYSKVLGPQPQGLWMGFITACGSLARTLGPIFVAQIYDAFGPRVTFAASCAILLITIVVNCVWFRRLLPYAVTPYRKRRDSRDSVDSEDSAGLPSSGGLQ